MCILYFSQHKMFVKTGEGEWRVFLLTRVRIRTVVAEVSDLYDSILRVCEYGTVQYVIY